MDLLTIAMMKKHATGTGGGSIKVDTTMSNTSTNPVQNKAIKAYIDGIALKGVELEVDKEVIAGSVNPVSSGAVYDALQNVEIDVDAEMSNTSTNPVQNKVAKAYTDAEVRKIKESVEGISIKFPIIGNLNPELKLFKEKVFPKDTNGVIEYANYDPYDTYILEICETGMHTIYAQGAQYRAVAVTEDKETVCSEYVFSREKITFNIEVNAKYLLIACARTQKDLLMINKGEDTSLSTSYVLPEAFNNYKDGFGEIFPDNIKGIENTGNLLDRAKLYKENAYFNYGSSKISFTADTTQDTYLMQIPKSGNYALTAPKAIGILCLDEKFIPIGTRKGFSTANNSQLVIDEGTKYILFSMVRDYKDGYSITFGNTTLEKPVYKFTESFDIPVDQEYNPESVNPQSGVAVEQAVCNALEEFTPKVELTDINGISLIGNLSSKIELFKEKAFIKNNNGIISYETYDSFDTYIFEVSKAVKYTFFLSSPNYRLATVAEDKQTIIGEYYFTKGKTVLDIGEDAKYLLFSIDRTQKDLLVINKGENIGLSTGYVLPEAFDNYKDGYSEIFPDNIKGIENVGNLLNRARLYKENASFLYTVSHGINFVEDVKYDIYLMKIEKSGTYAVTSKTGGLKILSLDETFCINTDSVFSVGGSTTNTLYIVNDNTKYLFVQIAKEDIGQASLTFGIKTEEKPIYKFTDGFVDYTQYGLPILYLYGDLSLLEPQKNELGQIVNDKPEATFSYRYGDKSGTCGIKHQGSSSMAYPKKNYTIKFDNKFEAKEGWGEQKKYCLKANYMDFSHARNVVSAKLWGQVVKSRANVDTRLSSLPNGGAVDGFPILIIVNDTDYRGLYTFNIPKDKWLFGITDGDNDLMVPSDDMTEATRFESATAGQVPTNPNLNSFEIEYQPDGVSDDEVWGKLNALIQTVIDNQSKETFETEVGKLADLDSFIDYCCFQALITGHDGIGKNYLLGAFDMGKWFISAYDMDSTYGVHWDGRSYLGVDSRPTFKTNVIDHKLLIGVKKYLPEKLKARYEQLRATVLSENNVQLVFYNFLGSIPKAIKDKECELWKAIPNTDTNNISQIMENYRLRCKYLDEQMSTL